MLGRGKKGGTARSPFLLLKKNIYISGKLKDMTIELIRSRKEDAFKKDRVMSTLKIIDAEQNEYRIPILEHRKYMPIEGIYEIRYEESPKFKVRLWEIYGIKGRSEIKFHHGKVIEHSRGCPLTTVSGLNIMHRILDSNKDHKITIRTEKNG